MGIVSGIVVFVMIWWVVLFTILPWGVYPEAQPQPGCAIEAPAKPYLKIKLLITTLVSVVIWLGVWWIIDADIVHFDS